jgi:hypothetical protein
VFKGREFDTFDTRMGCRRAVTAMKGVGIQTLIIFCGLSGKVNVPWGAINDKHAAVHKIGLFISLSDAYACTGKLYNYETGRWKIPTFWVAKIM